MMDVFMLSSPKTRRTRRTEGRGHVKPAGRMVPQSQALPESPAGLAQRRSDRHQRRRSSQQVQRVPHKPAARRRRSAVRAVFSWRAVSGTIVVGLSLVLYLFLTAKAFYVTSVAIGGEKYLTREEIFRYSDIAKRHIFWIDEQDVESRLEQVPNIAAADVQIGWPPNMVQILVTEREPALIWEQNVRVWVDVNGIIMKQREDRPDLLRIIAQDNTDPPDIGQRIPQSIIDGALYLRSRNPDIGVLLYDSVKGLGFRESGGWTVWFGNGAEMDVKLLVYNSVIARIQSDGIHPGEVMMSDPDRPVYTILWRDEGS
jgi:hypothetical protein